MLKTLPSVFLVLAVVFARGQGTKIPPHETKIAFDVIVGIAEQSETKTVRAVQKFFSEDRSGIAYLGYCNSQHCLILQANVAQFSSGDSVVNFLRSKFGASILGYKNYPVNEFYRNCIFKNEQEYKYFKTTYR